MGELIAKYQDLIMDVGLRIVFAALILVLGRWAAMIVRNIVQRMMVRGKVDQTLISFMVNLIYAALLAFVIIAALGKLGIQTASFIAVLGAAGLAIGLALQGSLANFAAGVLMLIFRPFGVGDKIEAAGVVGVVEEVQIFTTKLVTPDNKTIVVPNAKITESNIVNYTHRDRLRVDMVFGVSYTDDIDKVRSVIMDVLSQDKRILDDPAPSILLGELGDSSVNFFVRPWVKTADYWGVYFEMNEKMKKRFDAEGISIPFPQRDVHLYEHKED